MSLPDKSKLYNLYEAGKKDSSLGLPTSGYVWSSLEFERGLAYLLSIGNGYTPYYKGTIVGKALCVGD